MVNFKRDVYRNAGGKTASCQTNGTVGMLPIIIVMVKSNRDKGDQTDKDNKERRFLMM
jgi:hypothetical protein